MDEMTTLSTSTTQLFASLVQRVNDSFSADSPDCHLALTNCLALLQSFLIGPSPFSMAGSDPLRRRFLSPDQVSRMLNWRRPVQTPIVVASPTTAIMDCRNPTDLNSSSLTDLSSPTSNLPSIQANKQLSGRQISFCRSEEEDNNPIQDLHNLLEVC
ncbi:unnamed protein product [Protopolystoma xenopodis]|uniref:Uncharacterized protein n=1 Tax=Protopolystoma xenopodis TaxID=117903 RepID=A0A3S5A6Z6_9PLAT|nr:unnamed protein product [Protopolystoma xenopodis]